MSAISRTSPLRFSLEPVAPFRLDFTAWALRRRGHNLMDRWEDGSYGRVLQVGSTPVFVSVSQHGSRLQIHAESEDSLGARRKSIAAILDRTLGMSQDLAPFYEFAEGEHQLKQLSRRFRGVKPPRFPTVFEALLNGISCQQLTITVGITLLNRLTLRYGIPLGDEHRLFPRPEDLAGARPEDLRSLGYSSAKAASILGSARAVIEGRLDLEALHRKDDQAAMENLLDIPGVGPWTAGYVLLRGLGRLNVFPGGDVGAINNVVRLLKLKKSPDDAQFTRILDRWKPHAGLIYFHLLLERLSASGALK